jgi:hypothetical protein
MSQRTRFRTAGLGRQKATLKRIERTGKAGRRNLVREFLLVLGSTRVGA